MCSVCSTFLLASAHARSYAGEQVDVCSCKRELRSRSSSFVCVRARAFCVHICAFSHPPPSRLARRACRLVSRLIETRALFISFFDATQPRRAVPSHQAIYAATIRERVYNKRASKTSSLEAHARARCIVLYARSVLTGQGCGFRSCCLWPAALWWLRDETFTDKITGLPSL